MSNFNQGMIAGALVSAFAQILTTVVLLLLERLK